MIHIPVTNVYTQNNKGDRGFDALIFKNILDLSVSFLK